MKQIWKLKQLTGGTDLQELISEAVLQSIPINMNTA